MVSGCNATYEFIISKTLDCLKDASDRKQQMKCFELACPALQPYAMMMKKPGKTFKFYHDMKRTYEQSVEFCRQKGGCIIQTGLETEMRRRKMFSMYAAEVGKAKFWTGFAYNKTSELFTLSDRTTPIDPKSLGCHFQRHFTGYPDRCKLRPRHENKCFRFAYSPDTNYPYSLNPRPCRNLYYTACEFDKPDDYAEEYDGSSEGSGQIQSYHKQQYEKPEKYSEYKNSTAMSKYPKSSDTYGYPKEEAAGYGYYNKNRLET